MAYPSQGGPSYGGPGMVQSHGPHGFGPQGAPPTHKRSATVPVIIVISVLAVALGIVGGMLLTRGESGPMSKSATSSEVVRGYFEAVIAGDADAALAFGNTQPADRTLLTDEILAKARERAPITELNVSETNSQSVPVSYLLGDQRVNTTIRVEKTPDGPRMEQTWGALQLRAYDNDANVSRVVYGITITAEETPVFPGVYPVETGRTLLTWGPQATGFVPTPESYGATNPTLRPELSEDAVTKFRAAVETYLNKCLADKTLAPEGCPLDASLSSRTADPGSVTWTATEPMAEFDPSTEYDNPFMAESRISFEATATWTEDGETRTAKEYAYGSAKFDLTDDANPVFSFEK